MLLSIAMPFFNQSNPHYCVSGSHALVWGRLGPSRETKGFLGGGGEEGGGGESN